MSASARRNDVISIAPILVQLSRILHNNGTATAVLAVPVPPPLQTIDEVHKNKSGEGLAGLPDPELYIIVNGKPSKNKILWQSVVNVHHVKATVKKLKETN